MTYKLFWIKLILFNHKFYDFLQIVSLQKQQFVLDDPVEWWAWCSFVVSGSGPGPLIKINFRLYKFRISKSGFFCIKALKIFREIAVFILCYDKNLIKNVLHLYKNECSRWNVKIICSNFSGVWPLKNCNPRIDFCQDMYNNLHCCPAS